MKKISIVIILTVAVVLSLSAPALAQDYYFWTGDISTDMTTPGNWDNTSGNPRTDLPHAPDDYIYVGIDYTWTGIVTHINQPILNVDWNTANPDGDDIRALYITGDGNSLTITGNGRVRTSRRQSAIRDGCLLHVDTKTATDGPAFIGRMEFFIGDNGLISYPGSVATLRIDGEGYVQMERDGLTTGICMGAASPGLIEIRDNGKLELLDGAGFRFSSYDPYYNKVVISDNGQLLLYPGAAPPDPKPDTDGWSDALLDEWIAYGLITTDDPGGHIEYSGTNPTTLSVSFATPAVDASVKAWMLY
ncbi:hypothetical protein JW916_01905 [Candidatus Sumerlaeota bacterium]|nr:hypothetical protein [Candidatus Sumerlaeota bacterium]